MMPTTYEELARCPGWARESVGGCELLQAATPGGEGARVTASGRLSLGLWGMAWAQYPDTLSEADAVRLAHGFIALFSGRAP